MNDPFIDDTYFAGDNELTFENKDTTTFTNKWIIPFEKKILVKVLGRKLYDEFIEGLDVALPATPAQKWLDLRDGALFNVEYEGKTYPVKWNGLGNTDKQSLISYYVRSEWIRSNYTQMLGTGIAISDKKNAKTVDVREEYLISQGRAVDLIGKYPIDRANSQKVVLPDDFDESLIELFEPTLMNFLYHNKSDYESWVFSPLKKSNHFDI